MPFGKRAMAERECAGGERARRLGLRRKLGLKRDAQCQRLGPVSPCSSASSGSLSSDDEELSDEMNHLDMSPVDTRCTPMQSVSTTEIESSPSISPSQSKRRASASASVSSTATDGSTHSTSHKGVTYGSDGRIVCCRFCEILRTGDAEFVYEDDSIAVFRPLCPVVDSHVLVVPRCHIRNINMLTQDHSALLQRMRDVAEIVLARDGKSTQSIECKFAFHKPPFNSIDHVHMHAFRKNEGSFGCLGSIKYRTETWWCRSFEEVISSLDTTRRSRSLSPRSRHNNVASHSPSLEACISTR